MARGRNVLQKLDLIRVTDRILSAAGVLGPPELRSLDAIHLATAAELGRDLTSLIAYDGRIVTAAKQLGHKVVQPQ